MSEIYNQVVTLVRSARRVPHGASRLAMLEEAVRLSDVHQEEELAFWARRELMTEHSHLGMTERVAVTLAWCLARCDAEPERFDEEELLWPSKWPAENLVRYPGVSRAQIEAMHEDITRRFERHGASIRPLMMYRARAAMVLGDAPEVVRGWLDAMERHPRDEYSDCLACETNLRVEVLLHLGALDEALEVGAPILSGAQTCAEVPHSTLALLLEPLREAGRVEQAEDVHRRGWALVLGKQQFVREIAAHMDHLTLAGEIDKAAEALERHTRWGMETLDGSRQLAFWQAVEALALRAPGPTAPWRLPDALPVRRADVGVDLSSLAAYSAARVDQLAAQYAARDGHDGVPRAVAARRARHAAARA